MCVPELAYCAYNLPVSISLDIMYVDHDRHWLILTSRIKWDCEYHIDDVRRSPSVHR